jgi:hypothetical protein
MFEMLAGLKHFKDLLVSLNSEQEMQLQSLVKATMKHKLVDANTKPLLHSGLTALLKPGSLIGNVSSWIVDGNNLDELSKSTESMLKVHKPTIYLCPNCNLASEI